MREIAPLDGISLKRLQSFLEIVERGGIAAASGGDPTRQAQLSRQLTELETYFGKPLMDRKGGRRIVNEHGERLAEHVRWMFRGLADVRAGREVDEPTFVLAAGDSVLHWLVLPRVGEVRANFEIVALPAEEVVARLRDGSADFGIVRADDVHPELSHRTLGQVEHALFVLKELARGVGDDDVLFEVPLAMQIADRDFQADLREHAAKRGKSLRIALRCESFPQVLRAVRSGRYAGLLPEWAERDFVRGTVRVIEVAGRHRSRLHLAWSPRLMNVRRGAGAVLRRLTEVLKEAP